MARLRAYLKRRSQEFRAQSDYWNSLPDRALVKLLLAVFFMFSTVGIVGHIQIVAATGKSHWINAAIPAVCAGAGAAAFVFAFIRDKRYFLIIIPFQIGWMWLLARGVADSLLRPLSPEQVTGRIAAYGSVCTFTLLIGYVFFIDFIAREGVKHMGLRTVYVADVSGHGVAAGTLMSLTKGAMRARLLAGVSLSELVRDLNRVLLDLSSSNMFVTFAGIRLGGPGVAEVCLAGHLPILLFRHGSGQVERLPNESVPLGMSHRGRERQGRGARGRRRGALDRPGSGPPSRGDPQVRHGGGREAWPPARRPDSASHPCPLTGQKHAILSTDPAGQKGRTAGGGRVTLAPTGGGSKGT
jgi:hypothetical protein